MASLYLTTAIGYSEQNIAFLNTLGHVLRATELSFTVCGDFNLVGEVLGLYVRASLHQPTKRRRVWIRRAKARSLISSWCRRNCTLLLRTTAVIAVLLFGLVDYTFLGQVQEIAHVGPKEGCHLSGAAFASSTAERQTHPCSRRRVCCEQPFGWQSHVETTLTSSAFPCDKHGTLHWLSKRQPNRRTKPEATEKPKPETLFF